MANIASGHPGTHRTADGPLSAPDTAARARRASRRAPRRSTGVASRPWARFAPATRSPPRPRACSWCSAPRCRSSTSAIARRRRSPPTRFPSDTVAGATRAASSADEQWLHLLGEEPRVLRIARVDRRHDQPVGARPRDSARARPRRSRGLRRSPGRTHPDAPPWLERARRPRPGRRARPSCIRSRSSLPSHASPATWDANASTSPPHAFHPCAASAATCRTAFA